MDSIGSAGPWALLLHGEVSQSRPVKPEQPTLPSHLFKGWQTAVDKNIVVSGQPKSTPGRSRDASEQSAS
ncbi:MAG: hypothetical protein ACRYGF_09445 [Janthinobacterium lividum]